MTPKSRFYSSALYLRGVMRVKRQDLRGAEDAFCAIADVKAGDRIRFYIDGRYYALKDLARLGLGRIAHEEGRDDDAFYHYFLIPSDSKKLPDALFEAAWASLARKDYDLGARLVEEFLKLYGTTPRAAEARLLYATLQVKTCRFAEAEKGFDRALAEYEPLTRYVDRAHRRRRPRGARARRAPARRADEAARRSTPRTPTGMIAVDAGGRRALLSACTRSRAAWRKKRPTSTTSRTDWKHLGERVAQTSVQAVTGGHTSTCRCCSSGSTRSAREVRARAQGRGAEAATRRRRRWPRSRSAAHELAGAARAHARHGAGGGHRRSLGPGRDGRTPIALAAHQLRARAATLAWKLDAASGELIRAGARRSARKLDGMLRQARLGKIDAVVGQKRKLERQIEDLAAGRFPAEMFGKLHIEGLIGDDEEYWPPEPERWADEYENYK